jgi:hypothetical protein
MFARESKRMQNALLLHVARTLSDTRHECKPTDSPQFVVRELQRKSSNNKRNHQAQPRMRDDRNNDDDGASNNEYHHRQQQTKVKMFHKQAPSKSEHVQKSL